MNYMQSTGTTEWIASRARALGFELCGVVLAEKFPELARIEEWLERGYAGEMKYLEDARRSDPQLAMAGVRSVVVCGLNYNTKQPYSTQCGDPDDEEPRGWISRYAWGSDYHEVLWEKLNALVAQMKEYFPGPFEARGYADTGPVNERVLAKHAGLGWLGKNTLLLNQRVGSYFFLGTILTTLELEPTLGPSMAPPADLCGSCTRCIEACPTQALVEPYVMDARKCISYLTIELRGSIPEELHEPMGRHVFGCDICQDVCPWNRKAPVTDNAAFEPREFARPGQNMQAAEHFDDRCDEPNTLLLPRLEWLAAMSEEEFRTAFRGSPVKRTKWKGMVRNACIALGNSQVQRDGETSARIRTLLEKLSNSAEPTIIDSAQWALSRIQRIDQ
jgi:epoxyqueuosine reductase